MNPPFRAVITAKVLCPGRLCRMPGTQHESGDLSENVTRFPLLREDKGACSPRANETFHHRWCVTSMHPTKTSSPENTFFRFYLYFNHLTPCTRVSTSPPIKHHLETPGQRIGHPPASRPQIATTTLPVAWRLSSRSSARPASASGTMLETWGLIRPASNQPISSRRLSPSTSGFSR